MSPVRIYDNALTGCDAIVGKEAVKVAQRAALSGSGADPEVSPFRHIGRQHFFFLRRNVALRGIDHHTVCLLRDSIFCQQG